jgi:glycerol-1-phosphate dehydrogenase [NAD(P)+]
VLNEAGCPVRASQVSVSRDDLRDAILYSRLMRDRYTILDLVDAMGLLEQWAEEMREEFGG